MTVDTKILTVSQLNDYVKMLIDSNPMLGNIWVRGEVSNLTFHTSGHLYFSVKDEKSRVSAIMFRTNAVKLKFRPENGMKVVLHGRVSVFLGTVSIKFMSRRLNRTVSVHFILLMSS